MHVLQRDLAFVGLVGAVILGFHYFSRVDRRNRKRYTTPVLNFTSQKRQTTIAHPDHPYWRYRMIQYWNYDLN